MEFGPEVTSSDKGVKVMLNSQDKVHGTETYTEPKLLILKYCLLNILCFIASGVQRNQK